MPRQAAVRDLPVPCCKCGISHWLSYLLKLADQRVSDKLYCPKCGHDLGTVQSSPVSGSSSVSGIQGKSYAI